VRYAWRFASVLSRPMEASRFPHVAFDSSMARMPRPGDAIVFCTHQAAPFFSSGRVRKKAELDHGGTACTCV
jgi:hypothetical protein